jgi:hypothetical protein|tara:strand:+ start:261 stop:644 length:384 start_codon:yes stop_codon:yes gene_type:complete
MAGAFMAETPMAALNSHMKAISEKNLQDLRMGSEYPFVHIDEFGTKDWYETSNDVLDFPIWNHPNFGGAEITHSIVISSTGDLNVYLLTIQLRTTEQELGDRVQAIWAVARNGEDWLMSWRQFLGVI